MARKTPFLGKAEGCQLLDKLLADLEKLGEGNRAFYERGMRENPHLIPCALQHAWWIYREACDHCMYGKRRV